MQRGEIYLLDGVQEDCFVTDVVVTRQRISIDWKEDGDDGHLDATSSDGVHFEGNYGFPEKDSNLKFELKRYESRDEYLLFGTWTNLHEGNDGVWFIRVPRSKRAATIRKRPTHTRRK